MHTLNGWRISFPSILDRFLEKYLPTTGNQRMPSRVSFVPATKANLLWCTPAKHQRQQHTQQTSSIRWKGTGKDSRLGHPVEIPGCCEAGYIKPRWFINYISFEGIQIKVIRLSLRAWYVKKLHTQYFRETSNNNRLWLSNFFALHFNLKDGRIILGFLKNIWLALTIWCTLAQWVFLSVQ